MLKNEKERKVGYYEEALKSTAFIFFVDPGRISIRAMDSARNRLAELGAGVVFLKNTLARIVFERRGMEQVCELLVGPSLMIAGAGDIGAVAKYIRELQRESRDQLFAVKGVWFEGKVYSADDFKYFTNLPTISEARAKFLGVLREPPRRLVSLISEVRTRLVRCLSRRGEKVG